MQTLPDLVHLHLRRDGGALEVELDHGRTNEMGSAQLDEWEALCAALEDPATGARSLLTWSRRRTGKGTPLFIAGADVTERAGWSNDRVQAHVRRQRAVLDRLRRAPVFHVAVVAGAALGWGTEFLLTCDYRIATPDASFALPETGIGIVPGAGGTAELWSYVGVAQALRLGMTGERIDADEAVRIGLVEERAADLDAALGRARALCAAVGRRSPSAVAAFKAGVLASVGRDAAARSEIEARAYEHCVAGGDPEMGRASFKEITAGAAVAWPPLRRFSP
jgi:enoyl-CoA hydratase/carnithine racemase